MLPRRAPLLVYAGLSSVVVAACDSPTAPLSSLFSSVSMRCEAPPTRSVPGGRGHPARTGFTHVPLSGTPFAVAVSPAGVAYVTQAHAGSAARADLPSTTFSAPFPVGDLPSQVRFSPDGRTAYVSNQDARTITVVEVATNRAVATIPEPGHSILTLGLSPDGARLYALTDFNGVYVVNTSTREVIDSIPVSATGDLLTGVAFHPVAPCMYIAARDAGTITTVDLRSNTIVRTETIPGARVQNVAVSRDGALLFATDIERSKLLVRDLTAEDATFVEYTVGSGQWRNAFDVAITPDNTQVYVSALADGKVFVLDLKSRELIGAIVTGGSPRYIGFTAEGTHAVIANEFGWVTFVHSGTPLPAACLSPATGTPPADRTHPVTGNETVPLAGTPFAVSVSPTGVAYVTQAHAASAARMDLPSTTFSTPFPVGDLPSQVRISPDGQTAYVSNQDASTITVLDVATNHAVATIPVPGHSILTLGLSPDGTRLYALTDYFGIYVIDTGTRQVVGYIPNAGYLLTGVAFHPFAPCMYVAARDQGIISTVDLRDNSVVSADAVPGARIQNVAVSRDGRTLFATDIERSKLLVRDLTTESAPFLQYTIGSGQWRNAFDVAITPDNTQVYVSALADGKVYVLDRATRALVDSIVTDGAPRYIAFNAQGTHALVPNEYGWVSVIHEYTPPPTVCTAPPTGTAPEDRGHPSRAVNESVPLGGAPFAVAVSAAGVAYVTQSLAASAVRADLPSTTLSTPFPVGDLPSQVRISPDGRTAYVSNQDASTITVLDVATDHAVATIPVPGHSILTTGLSPDGTRLYALTDFYGVYVIDTGTRQVVGSIPNAGYLLTGVAFHPFAPCMYLAARDEGRIRTVDMGSNRVVRVDAVPGARIQNVAVSRDGRTLFATDIERSKLLVRDLTAASASYLEYAVGSPYSRNAFDVAITPDNAQVYVSTLADGKVYVFDRATRALIDAIATDGSPRYIGFNTSGTYAVVANEYGWVNFIH
jgi:YVTN family beta-propeller protein